MCWRIWQKTCCFTNTWKEGIFNYKRSFSIVLLALCNAFCQYTVVDVAVVDIGEAPIIFTLIICIILIILHVYINVFINFYFDHVLRVFIFDWLKVYFFLKKFRKICQIFSLKESKWKSVFREDIVFLSLSHNMINAHVWNAFLMNIFVFSLKLKEVEIHVKN